MKRTILVGVMVLGTSFCSQSFGFDLLDRMLGLKGAGCDSTCCDTVVCDPCEPVCGAEPCGPCEPVCGAEPCGSCTEPVCGCEAPCEPVCGADVSCAPACGCETIVSCAPKKGLLDRLFGGKKCCDSGCDVACEPTCAAPCEPACGADVCCEAPVCGAEVVSCCKPKKAGLLAKLFGKLHCDSGCDTSCDAIGCSDCAPSAPAAPEAAAEEAMPPAPVVDSSASLSTKRRVIQASNRVAR